MSKLLKFKVFVIIFFAIEYNSYAFSFKQESRSHIQIVGSSTVYPFTSVIAESFGRDSQYRTPIVEATGTGGGLKLLCSGIGFNYPDISNASRSIKKSEIKNCQENGIRNIIEAKIGYDGIVLANIISGLQLNLSKKDIFLALASKIPNDKNQLIDNPYNRWKEINPNLPDVEIAVYGTPPTSGTRDAFVELVMEKACINLSAFRKKHPDKKSRKKACHLIRSDGKFIEAGENDNLIVKKLKSNPKALGIFGFSFLSENKDSIKAATIDNITPSFDSIVKGSYKISRPLYIYFKGEHLDLIPGMREFAKEVISKNTIGFDGYLLQKGLIPLSNLESKKMRDRMANL